MDIEASIVAPQNALVVNPSVREPQREVDARQQQEQRQNSELPRQQTVVRSGDAQAYEQAEKYRQKQGQVAGETFRERSDAKAEFAISAYQSLQNEARREEIKQMMGVDTYV